MVLRQQIREKDAMIDNLLNRVNPGPTMATPLTLVPARLPLSAKERAEYRDVLTYLERAAQQAGQRFMGDGRTKFDISALEDVMSEDESESEEDAPGLGVPEGLLSPKRAVSPRGEQAAGSQSQSQSQSQVSVSLLLSPTPSLTLTSTLTLTLTHSRSHTCSCLLSLTWL